MRVELLHAPGCPNVAAVRALVLDCLAATGAPDTIVERIGDYPSPTLLIDGHDVMGEQPPTAAASACRLDLPTKELVLAALRTQPTTARPEQGE